MLHLMPQMLKAGCHPERRRSVVSAAAADAVVPVEPQELREWVAQQVQASPTLALQVTLMI